MFKTLLKLSRIIPLLENSVGLGWLGRWGFGSSGGLASGRIGSFLAARWTVFGSLPGLSGKRTGRFWATGVDFWGSLGHSRGILGDLRGSLGCSWPQLFLRGSPHDFWALRVREGAICPGVAWNRLKGRAAQMQNGFENVFRAIACKTSYLKFLRARF